MSDAEPVTPPPDDASEAEALLDRHARALLSSQDGFWERDLVANRSWYSPSFWTMLGFVPGELPNDREVVNARIHRDDLGAFLDAYQRAIDTLGSFTYELRLLDRDGQWRWVRGRARTWPGPDGRAAVIAGALSDVHQEKLARLALEAMSQRFERAIAASEEALFERTVGSDDVYVSDRFFEILEERPQPMPISRKALVRRIHPDDQAAFERVKQEGLAHEDRKWNVSFRFRRQDGEYRWLRLRGRAYPRPDGTLLIAGMVGDIHERVLSREEVDRSRRLLEELVRERTASLEQALAHAEAQRQEAERANRAKSRFLAHMSHEIRTPLNGVLGLNELALRLATVPAQQRYIESALRSGQALRQVIDDVLDLSRVEAGGLHIKQGAFDLSELLAEALRVVMPLVRSKGLWVRYDWTEGPAWVVSDAERIRQIVTNLVGNAAKFTEHGHLALVARTVATASGRRAEVRVIDTGPGLSRADLERIFEAFVQADETLSRRHGGTGLGLTIARGLARAMGGELSVEHSGPDGSTFLLALPVVPSSDPDPLPPPGPGVAWLVVPSAERGRWLASRIERLHWTVETVVGMAAAIDRAAREPAPELVIVSEQVFDTPPDLAGLRARLPAATISLLIQPDWHDATIEAQAAVQDIPLTVAPVTPRDLLRLTGTARRPRKAPAADAATVAATPAEVLLVEDNAVNRLIGEEFLRTIGLQVRSAEDGAEAIEQCLAQAPSLVLMDLQMPVMDGLEAMRRLRALQRAGRLAEFPIVALTAHATPEDRDAVAAAGADGYLTKPILLEQLREELGQWLPLPAP